MESATTPSMRHLYPRTDYTGSLHVLAENPAPDDAAACLPTGKNYFMSGHLLFAEAGARIENHRGMERARAGGSTG